MMPLPQEFLPILLLLLGGGFPLPVPFNLAIKPENIAIARPARASITHTAGTPFIDDYGQGVGVLTIQGHTGWNPELFAPLRGLPFFEMLQLCFTLFLNRRQALKQQNQDPEQVQLLYFDAMNVQAFAVFPQEFVLERTRTRPLLYLYRMRLAIVEDMLYGP